MLVNGNNDDEWWWGGWVWGEGGGGGGGGGGRGGGGGGNNGKIVAVLQVISASTKSLVRWDHRRHHRQHVDHDEWGGQQDHDHKNSDGGAVECFTVASHEWGPSRLLSLVVREEELTHELVGSSLSLPVPVLSVSLTNITLNYVRWQLSKKTYMR